LNRIIVRRAWFLILATRSPNAEGMLVCSNINIHEEMADLIVASRSFEGKSSPVVKNARNMAMQTLSIGKR
jgi:flagellar basal body rod protein FlgC